MPQARPRVSVVGLGPAGADLVPEVTARLLKGASGRAYLRTVRHPAAAAFAGARTFDDLYEDAETFDDVYRGIVEALVGAATGAAPEPIVYAVPGSPSVAERSVALLRADGRVDVTVHPAPSFLDLAWVALGIDPLAERVRLVDAADFATMTAREEGPFLVAQCWSRAVLSEVKLAFDEDEDEDRDGVRPVLLHHLGLADEEVTEVDWWELDRSVEPDHLTSLYVPPSCGVARPVRLDAGAEVARLTALMRTLRERCPWDRAQTHASLMPHLTEESYEVLDALAVLAESDDAVAAYAHLEEELGDLLFQIVFHAQLAVEADRFDLAEVARGVHDKLVSRHPHVFGDVTVENAAQVVSNWEALKKSEKGRTSVTEGIPEALPALMLAAKLSRKARAVGLEPLGGEGLADGRAVQALASLLTEAGVAAALPDDPLAADARELGSEVGELLLAIVDTAQRLGIDAEQALRSRARQLRADIVAAEGVPDPQVGNR